MESAVKLVINSAHKLEMNALKTVFAAVEI